MVLGLGDRGGKTLPSFVKGGAARSRACAARPHSPHIAILDGQLCYKYVYPLLVRDLTVKLLL